ncbi:Fe-S cluster assembly sulfur transfer protein SufU [Leifsonia sp. SIMBA_070]|uniref:Fe-S cluster assembly sulfur transfer protein SufU n=1 Tax=Leifsonia sp. SIMBA_070 TaxID=3085810 RepID=UPI00397AC2A0
MSDLQNLYQQVILDHAREKHGFGLTGDEAAASHQFNPTCGDEVTVGVRTAPDGRILSIGWEGHGCSISTASASLLSDLVDGVDRERLAASIGAFRELMHSKGALDGDEELLGDAVALAGVSKYVTRVKCAMLPWVALEDALLKSS